MMHVRCLITGINGFVGAHLTGALLDAGHTVWGATQPGTSCECLGDMRHRVKLVEVEITDPAAVKDVVRRSRPDRIFHLAAQSHVPTAWADPVGTFRTNVEGTLNLLEAAARMRTAPRVLLISSGDVYGDRRGVKGTIRETSPILPLNPYAASKAAAEMVAQYLHAGRNLPVVIVRPFNHIGPGQSSVFVTADFATQIARIEAGRAKPVIKVGDLSARKDFADVRDIIQAYIAAIEFCDPGKVYNICSGKSRSINEVLDMLIKISGISVRIVQEKKRLRVTSSSALKVSANAFKKITGWKPLIPFRKTLADILDCCREQIKNGDSG